MPRIQAAWSRAQQQTSRRRNAQARLLEPVGAAPRSLPSLAQFMEAVGLRCVTVHHPTGRQLR